MPVFNRISQTAPDALTLLRIFCFCDPERIPISILEQGCRALSQEDRRNIPTAIAEAVDGLFRSSIRLRKAIQEIQRLSLAVYTMKGSEGIVRIHDLVQLLLRSKLVATAERRQWLEMVIYVVCTAFKRIGDRRSPQNWSQCSQFVSHIEFMEGFAEQYGLHNTMLLDANMWAAIYLNECGLYEKAADIHRRIYERRKAALGEEHPKTLTSLSNLARVYSYQGRWKEAKVLFTGLMETWERVLGEEYPGTLRSISNLAAVYREQGHWKESERLLVEVIETMKIVQGENHPDTLDSISSLASIYWEQGRWKEAESLVVGVIETWKIVRGEHHPDTLGSISSLGAIYVGQRRWKEAEGLQNGVLETRKRVLGEEHPATLYSMNNLACIWKEQGQNAKAISLMGECVHLQTRILGASHHETLSSSAFLSEWQTQEPEVVSSASNSEDRTTKEERKRLDEGSDRAPH